MKGFITPNIYDNDVELLYKNKPVLTALELSNCYFISPNGDDATGLKGRIDKPYKTLTKVFEVIAASECVYFFPGTYNVGTLSSDKANLTIYLQSAVINGNIYLPAGNGTYLSDGNGVINGDVGILGIDNSKVYYVKNLKKVQLARGTIYVDGVGEINLVSDACRYYLHNIAKITAGLHNGGIIELINVREIVPQQSLAQFRGAVIRNCRFYTDQANTRNFTFGTNNLVADTTGGGVVFRDCEFVSTLSYNFHANGEDILNGYLKFHNCRFIAGAAYHIDMVPGGGFPNTKLNPTFISCDFNKLPVVNPVNVAATTTSFSITPNLIDNNSDLLYKGLGLATIVNQGNVVFVSKNGDDTKGLVGRIDRPYQTIMGAINAAGANKTVVVLGGVYNEQITASGGAVSRLLLWFGATITSAAAYTVRFDSKVVIEGQGLYMNSLLNHHDSESAIINTNTDGITLKYGSNPGHIYMSVSNVSIVSHGTGVNAGCIDNQPYTLFNYCRFHSAKQIFINGYGSGISGIFKNCFFTSLDLLAQFDSYSSMNCLFEGCHFDSVNGFKIAVSSLRFKGCSIKTSVGHGLLLSGGNYLVIEDTLIQAQNKAITGTLPYKTEIINSKLLSATSFSMDVLLSSDSRYTCEIRDSKLISEASQLYSIQNTNAANKQINLINVAANKPYHANVDGIIHNVIIDDTLTALNTI